MSDLDRRTFLKGAGGAGLPSMFATAATAPLAHAETDRQEAVDVLILGAGYAGLAAARMLRSNGRTVAVLEARDRVGGRTLDRSVANNRRIELGGQYIVPAQTRVLELAKEMGLETYTSWNEGDWFFNFGERVARYRSSPVTCLVDELGQPEVVRTEIEGVLQALNDLYPGVSAATPWQHPDAEAWDDLTFESWIDARVQSRPARRFLRLMTNQAFSTEPGEISFLQMLWFLKTSHGIPGWAVGGPQANRIDGGTGLLAERLARGLGEDILLGHDVLSVRQQDNTVSVATTRGVHRARAVVFCLPPQLTHSVRFDPPLPSDLYRAFDALQGGMTIKVQAVYEQPFWRKRGWSGNGISFEAPQAFTFDNTPRAGSPGVLLGFIAADQATEWSRLTPERRKATVLDQWAAIFGKQALEAIDYVEMNWPAETFTRGGHGGHFGPGFWRPLGAALGGERMPCFGRVWWAASDLAKDWVGYLEGALRAGEQAAGEVDRELG
jgi:monoamine oxidase